MVVVNVETIGARPTAAGSTEYLQGLVASFYQRFLNRAGDAGRAQLLCRKSAGRDA
jgi:hypothetical protein